jgi:hypothetical protein
MLGTGTNGLGHSNPRQKIQYHLKLKQELEELRHEATVLLRERFHLQQCIRCVCGIVGWVSPYIISCLVWFAGRPGLGSISLGASVAKRFVQLTRAHCC